MIILIGSKSEEILPMTSMKTMIYYNYWNLISIFNENFLVVEIVRRTTVIAKFSKFPF